MSGVVLLDGNPRPGSRTVGIGRTVSAAVAEVLGLPFGHELTLSSLLPSLASPSPEAAAEVDAVVATACSADVLVVATPMYKATYTGLLKLFLDRLPRQALGETLVVPVVTAGIPHHLLAGEVHLRPLLVELGAWVPTRAFVLAERDFPELEAAVERWIGPAGSQLRRALPQRV